MKPLLNLLRNDRGFALVTVLGVCLLLALLGSGFAASVRGNLRTAAAAVETAQAEALAEAGITLAKLDLIGAAKRRPDQRRFPIDGTAVSCLLDDGSTALVVQIEDEGGKINLNTPNANLLEHLFAGLGAAPEEAKRFAAWRGEQPYQTIEELNRIPGLPEEIAARAATFVTVHSTAAGVDPATAPPELTAVLKAGAAVLGVDGSSTISAGLGDDIATAFQSRSGGQAFTVRSLGQLANGTRVVIEAVAEVPQTPAKGLVMKSWRRGSLRSTADRLLNAPAATGPC